MKQQNHHFGFLWEQGPYLKLFPASEQVGRQAYTQRVRNFPLSSSTKNIPVETAQQDIYVSQHAKGKSVGILYPMHDVDHSSSSQLPDSDRVYCFLFIPTSYDGWDINMLLAVYNAFILHIATNHNWCHANSLYCNYMIEIRLPVEIKYTTLKLK